MSPGQRVIYGECRGELVSYHGIEIVDDIAFYSGKISERSMWPSLSSMIGVVKFCPLAQLAH